MKVRVDAVFKKIAQFKADTEKRRRTVRLQDARLALDAAEELITNMAEQVKPLEAKKAEEGEPENGEEGKLSQQDAEKICEQVGEADAAAQAKLEEAQAVGNELPPGDKEHKEELAQLSTRFRELTARLGESRKTAKEYEERFVAEQVVAQAREVLEKAKEQVKELSEACAPLVERGGEEFLVAVSARTLADALRQYMKEIEVDEAGLFAKVGAGG